MTKTRTTPICTSPKPSLLRGLTPVSIAASLFAMLLLGMVVQIGEVVLHIPEPIAEHPLALPAIWIVLLLLLVAAIVRGFAHLQLLTKPELLCVFYALLLAAPLMTQGFWHRIVSITATIPRNVQNYDKIDAFSDALWPHGANVLADRFAQSQVATSGQVTWAATEYRPGVVSIVPTLANISAGEAATLRARIPIDALVPGEPYLISILVRAKDLGPNAHYVARLHVDGTPNVTEVFSSAAPGKTTALQPQGFVRVGAYNVKLPEQANTFVELEFSLVGDGRVELADPKMLNVAALEGLYKGKPIIKESDFLQLPANQRAGFIVKPDNMWSLKGVSFLLAGYIPIRDWLIPLAAWGSFLLLLLLAFVAINSLLRRQWLDNERYLMPIAKIPQALLGEDPLATSAFTSIWHSRWMWGGLILGLLWGAAKHLSRIDPDLFDPSLTVDLRAYLSSPSFGEMFTGMRFEVSPLLLAMCLFMELNVLISLVCGFWLFRAQFWLGHVNAWSVDPQYPYRNEQVLGSYLAYALVALFLIRRYLYQVVKVAFTDNRGGSAGEILSYRTALILLGGCAGGLGLWAWYLGIGVGGMLAFVGCLLAVGLVASKLRTECGTPWGYFAPYNLALIMVLLGGIGSFGPGAVLFGYVAAFFIGPSSFFLIPGGQLELMELGRRWRVKPAHIIGTIVLAVVGGVVFGGWSFLSNGYALGADHIGYNWAFDTKPWYFFAFNDEVARSTNAMVGGEHGAAPTWVASYWSYGFAAAVTVILTVLRQVFSGLWFHPIGFILGPTSFVESLWGSALMAWVIRLAALRLGGAATVREKLRPLAVGLFIGAASAQLGVMLLVGSGHGTP